MIALLLISGGARAERARGRFDAKKSLILQSGFKGVRET
jgi:hypothetical protein